MFSIFLLQNLVDLSFVDVTKVVVRDFVFPLACAAVLIGFTNLYADVRLVQVTLLVGVVFYFILACFHWQRCVSEKRFLFCNDLCQLFINKKYTRMPALKATIVMTFLWWMSFEIMRLLNKVRGREHRDTVDLGE